MKKLILSFLIILTAVCAAVAITSCAPEQEHDWGEWSAAEGQAPTCTENGLESRVCLNCGERQERPVEKLGHDWADYVHDEDGTPDNGDGDTHTRACKRESCNATETDSCQFIIDIIDPTCQKGGYTVLTCTCCGYSDTRDVNGPVPHKYTGEWEYSGDMLSGWDGTPRRAHSRRCDYGCGIEIAEPCEHDSLTVAADCENGGYTIYTCKVCGHSYTDEETQPLGHRYGEYAYDGGETHTHTRRCEREGCNSADLQKCEFTVKTTAATCVSEGSIEYTCKVCGYGYTETFGKLNHVWGEWQYSKEVKNTHYRTCLREGCDQTETDKCEHDSVTVAADCENGGFTVYTCKVCGHGYTDEETQPLGHRYGEYAYDGGETHTHTRRCEREGCNSADLQKCEFTVKTTAATCVSEGSIEYTCKVCGYGYTETIEKLNHIWGEWQYSKEVENTHYRTCLREGCDQTYSEQCKFTDFVTEATCLAEGYTRHVCNDCKYTYTDGYTGLADHKWSTILYGGDTLYNHRHEQECRVCKEKREYAPVVLVSITRSDPTCTDVGRVYTYCTGCDKAISEPIPALGHDWGDWKYSGQRNGIDYHYHRCTRCSRYESAKCSIVDVEQVTTCVAPGTVTETCELCFHAQTKNGADVMLGHDWGDWTPVEGGHIRYCMREGCEAADTQECSFSFVTTDPTCEEEGSVVYTCSTCGYTYTEIIPQKGHIFKGGWKCGEDGTHYRECHNDPSHIETEPCTFKTEDEGDCVKFTCTVCGYTYTVNRALAAECVRSLVIFKRFRLV